VHRENTGSPKVAIVALEGALGEVVARALARAEPRFQTERIAPADVGRAVTRAADLVIVDEAMAVSERAHLSERFDAPLLIIGSDIDKPFTVADLRRAAVSAARRPQLDTGGMVAVDPPLRRAIRVVEQVAARRQGVLVTGPTGCGKELIARRVHVRSGRRGNFVAVNCAAFNEGLAESTLFGHVRGAFTGAVSGAVGAFVEAHEGTLFLDEIGELDLSIQAKLLRALEEGFVRAVGASKPTAIDVRIVAATNRDLRHEVAVSRFRADLYFRLATFVVEVPALRERPRDLDALIERFHAQHDRAARISLGADARRALASYTWPGNVRELRNVMERVLSLAAPGRLTEAALLQLAPELAMGRAGDKTEKVEKAEKAEKTEKTSPRQALAKNERQTIRARLASGDAQRQKLADELGIHRSTLWRKMKRIAASEDPPPSRF